ncbi:PVC-type heme-binding CxxCH protein [Stieleria varia]|uniref:Cytochrome c n=1 Tax=Stieleria varia TaxID=2528005 RepID=A0A5C6AXZ0_9BACT|nr:PVC-type heme-binding CxxCH protein [Stieleria varia]TWU04498.1 Cytochrome c [Stieleria varia]
MRCFLAIMTLGFACACQAEFPPLFNTEPVSDESLMTPADAAAGMKLPEGFTATAFAAEPNVQNPIAMTWDGKGRLWIAENYTYAERTQRFQLDLHDRVVILDGATGDQMTKRTVFTDNVQMLTGIEVGMGGVWLMCPPKLLFIPDANQDDVPDGPAETVLDGFTVAAANYHNFANGIRFGPDGWLYGRCGGSCPGRIGVPGTDDANRLAMEGGIWRYHPRRKTVEVLTSGTTNPWGHDWNSLGEMFFVNTVNGHLWHMIPGSHLTRPFLLDPNRRTYELIDFHADHWHFDTTGSWTDSRDGAANQFGGGHAHSGCMVYQGDAWPEKYRGQLFTLNFHGRRANQERLQREGSGYVARHDEDFMIATDTWFRGMDLSSGPDGNVFVIDWSDAGECHEHTGVHRTSGRVFKIKPSGAEQDTVIPAWSSDAIIAGLTKSRNVWHQRQAQLALMSHPENPQVVTALRDTLAKTLDAPVAIRCLTTLHSIDQLEPGQLTAMLSHSNEHVRAWAIRLATDAMPIDDCMGPHWKSNQSVSVDPTLLQSLVDLAAHDKSALVRLTLASTLQRLPVERRAELALPLVAHASDADDHNLPLMIWYGLIPVADTQHQQIAAVAAKCELPTTLRLISRVAAEEIEKQPAILDSILVACSDRGEQARGSVLQGISEGLIGWQRAPKPEHWDDFVNKSGQQHVDLTRELNVLFGDGRAMQDLIEVAMGKTDASDESRLAALEKLIQIDPPQLREICESLLGNNRLNVMAARGLSKFNDPSIGKAIVNRYGSFRAPFRPQVVSILSSRPSFATELLHAIEDGKISRSDLSAFQARQILSLGDDTVAQLVRDVWGDVRESSDEKKARMAALTAQLGPDSLAHSDRSAGRAVFAKTCQTCHRLYGVGGKVGPDLTGSNRNNLDYLVSNIVDPSSVVDKNYRMSLILMTDGRVISGLVTDENDKSVSIQTATEALVLSKDQIESRKLTDKSSMPEGLIDTLSETEVRDLFGYLSHPTQVDLPE